MIDNQSPIQLKKAGLKDAIILTKTAFESKNSWGYTDEQMNLWTDELTITAAYIAKNKVYKIFDKEKYIGFISLITKNACIEVDHFWLLPESIGKGYGRAIFAFIVQTAKKSNYTILRVYSEPHADGFYKKMGGEIVHRIESKIKGRFLSVFEFSNL